MALSKKTRKALDDAFEAMSEEQAHAFLIFLAPFFEEDDSDVMESDDEDEEDEDEEDEDEEVGEADEEDEEDEDEEADDEDEEVEEDEDEDEDEEEADEDEDEDEEEDEEEADEDEDEEEEEEEPVKPTRKKPAAAAPAKKPVAAKPVAAAPAASKGVDLTLDTEELEKLAIKYRLGFAPAKKESLKRKHLLTAFTAFNAAHKKLGRKPFDQLLKIAAKAGVSYKQDKGRPDPEKNKNQLIAMLVNEGAV